MSTNNTFRDVRGPVNTGNPVNTGGNQVVGAGSVRIGRDSTTAGMDPATLDALVELRAQLHNLRLTGPERLAAADDLTRVEQAAKNPGEAARAFGSFLERLKRAGALATASAEIIAAATRIARWAGVVPAMHLPMP